MAGATGDGTGSDRPEVGSSAWWEAQGGRRQPLSRDRIVAAALRLIEVEGADAVTMRRLGEDLGAAPASLYRHVESREALMLLVGEAILAEVRLDDDPEASWQDRTTVYADAVRRAVRRSRGRATFILGPDTPVPAAYSLFQRGVQVYLDSGFPAPVADAAAQAVAFVALSFASLEAEWPDALAVEAGALLADGCDRSPAAGGAPGDEMFDFLLDAVIQGIAGRLAAEDGGAPGERSSP